MNETELKLLANALNATYAALDREVAPETVSTAVCSTPVAAPLLPERDPDPTHWSNWRTRGDGYGDTACGMPFKTGQ